MDDGFDLDIPHSIGRNMELYTVVTFVFIPLMAVGGFFVPSTAHGALVLSTLMGMIFVTVVFSQEEVGKRVSLYSVLLVALSSWSPLLMSAGTDVSIYFMMYTSMAFSWGNYSIVRWFSHWREFWKGNFGGK